MSAGSATALRPSSAPHRDADASRPVWLVAKGVLIENVRRRDVYILLLLMGLFAVAAIVLRIVGITNAATGRFALNLGLTLAAWSSLLVTGLTVVRQLPGEIETRTLLPTLARPLGRGQFLAGKALAAWLSGLLTVLVLAPLAWFPVPKLEAYPLATLAQGFLLHAVALAMIAGAGMLLSLLVPKPVNLVLLLLAVMQGGWLAGYVRARAIGTPLAGAMTWLSGYLPNLSNYDLARDYTDGLPPLPVLALAARVGYGAAVAAGLLLLATAIFRRRAIG